MGIVKKTGFGLVVLLVAIVGLVVVRITIPYALRLVPGHGGAKSEPISATGAKLAAAKTARIAFTGTAKGSTSVQFSGTTSIAFAADPTFASDASWTTTYVKPQFGPQSQRSTVIRVGGNTYIESPDLTTVAGKPWADMAKTSLLWNSILLDPSMGFTDFTIWQQKLTNMTKPSIANSETGDNKYKIACYQDNGCSNSFGTDFDKIANQADVPTTYTIRYDDDGLIRRLDIDGMAEWNNGGNDVTTADLWPHESSPIEYHVSFTLSDFGTPVTVTAPPADEIAGTDKGIVMKSS